jgi:hypothetical protein
MADAGTMIISAPDGGTVRIFGRDVWADLTTCRYYEFLSRAPAGLPISNR